MREFGSMLWWMLLYPAAAAVAMLAGIAVYYAVIVMLAVPGVAAVPYISLATVLLPTCVTASVFVRVAGGLAPEAKLGAASAACGIVLLAALLGWNRLHVPAAWVVIVPLALGALGGLARTQSAQRRRERAAAAQPTDQAAGTRT